MGVESLKKQAKTKEWIRAERTLDHFQKWVKLDDALPMFKKQDEQIVDLKGTIRKCQLDFQRDKRILMDKKEEYKEHWENACVQISELEGRRSECEKEFARQLEHLTNKKVEKRLSEIQKDLKPYLLGHEYDIAVDMEDFGGLDDVFKIVVGREAEK